ncbi:MAG: hypothetical protein D6736_09635 [Nitrospinota bacterium]|nr:MAG: hypothetical protein D6736_09635 [Nitrospinota bacterium]
MKLTTIKSGLVSVSSALVASLCCALPLAVVLLGLGSGAFMMTTMRYRWLFLPIGVIGVSLGYILYIREKRRCARLACRMAGSRLNLVLLLVATLLLAFELVLTFAPQFSASLLSRVMAENTMNTMFGTMRKTAGNPSPLQNSPTQMVTQGSPQTPLRSPISGRGSVATAQATGLSTAVLKISGMV